MEPSKPPEQSGGAKPKKPSKLGFVRKCLSELVGTNSFNSDGNSGQSSKKQDSQLTPENLKVATNKHSPWKFTLCALKLNDDDNDELSSADGSHSTSPIPPTAVPNPPNVPTISSQRSVVPVVDESLLVPGTSRQGSGLSTPEIWEPGLSHQHILANPAYHITHQLVSSQQNMHPSPYLVRSDGEIYHPVEGRLGGGLIDAHLDESTLWNMVPSAPNVSSNSRPFVFMPEVHTQIDFEHKLVPDLLQITNCGFYWGKIDRYEAERLLDKKPEGTFLLRDSAQDDFVFSLSFRRFDRSLHARIEQHNNRFSFDSHDPNVFHSSTVTGLIDHYRNPNNCVFFEPCCFYPVTRPYPFTLQHLSRAAITDRITYKDINRLPLPKALKSYLKEYHYRQQVEVRHFDIAAVRDQNTYGRPSSPNTSARV